MQTTNEPIGPKNVNIDLEFTIIFCCFAIMKELVHF